MSDKTATTKFVCTYRRCQWHGLGSQLLMAVHPFAEGDVLVFCPECKDVATIREACAHDDCWREASCGAPTPDGGYERTCHDHFRFNPPVRHE